MGSTTITMMKNNKLPSNNGGKIPIKVKLQYYGRSVLYNTVPILILLIIWEIVASMRIVHPSLFPKFTTIVKTIVEQIFLGNYFSDVAYSMYRVFIGGGLGIVAGTFLGLIVGFNRTVERWIIPVLQFIISIPGVAIFPIAVLWLGLTETSILAVLVLECGVTVVFNVWTGVKTIPEVLINAAETMGEKGFSLFRRILIPAALPTIVTGYRLGFARAWRVLVAGEMLSGIGAGLGYRVYSAQEFFDSELMLAGVLSIALLGLLIERVVFRSIEVFTVERWGVLR
ncbi:MetI-like domain [Moorella glycerini]|uniref:Aliphatic sulfonates transport permease protein SsuC n=1 Tax=Neomoorella stamsii TaxID=1266720 RepID=A0A9X7J4U5_9FIRM|nr:MULTISPECIES: ABC transporter permease [Moorella]PRR76663.1 putative aliphatic sulfonates transport permease protein SsuC [Moorella stamsii]CEP66805.1 MetI-like domain [Moorella glycerini]